MAGKKRARNKTSNYLISTESKKLKKRQQGTLGKLRSNFLGTEFHIYDEGVNPKKKVPMQNIRKELGIVQYKINVLGTKGPRKMKVILPAIDSEGRRALWRPMNDVSYFYIRNKEYQPAIKLEIGSCLWNFRTKRPNGKKVI